MPSSNWWLVNILIKMRVFCFLFCLHFFRLRTFEEVRALRFKIFYFLFIMFKLNILIQFWNVYNFFQGEIDFSATLQRWKYEIWLMTKKNWQIRWLDKPSFQTMYMKWNRLVIYVIEFHTSTKYTVMLWRVLHWTHIRSIFYPECVVHEQWKSIPCHRHQINNYVYGPCSDVSKSERHHRLYHWGIYDVVFCFSTSSWIIPSN